MSLIKTQTVLNEVYAERERQEKKWGEQNHNAPMWFGILGEEVGEVANAFLERDAENYRTELIQVAAVAVAAVEAYDRGTTNMRNSNLYDELLVTFKAIHDSLEDMELWAMVGEAIRKIENNS